MVSIVSCGVGCRRVGGVGEYSRHGKVFVGIGCGRVRLALRCPGSVVRKQQQLRDSRTPSDRRKREVTLFSLSISLLEYAVGMAVAITGLGCWCCERL